jgi:hypothetical protein
MMPPGECAGMKSDFKEDVPTDSKGESGRPSETLPPPTSEVRGLGESSFLSRWMGSLLQMGLGESLLRGSTTILSILSIVIVIWLMQAFYLQGQINFSITGAQAAGPTPRSQVNIAAIPALENPAPLASQAFIIGISRHAQLHTNVPTRPRQDIIKYIVQDGDTVFGIADKYGLEPETILYANYGALLDDPHALQPGQELIILPSDGVYWQWVKENKDGLIGFAKYFSVNPVDIVNAPVNHLKPETIGDYANPNIPDGTWLFIPGGKRDFISWSAPLGVTRENPASARVLGPGACDPVVGGLVGYGTYVWPTDKHYRSGFDFSPKTNHMGVDLAGNEGNAVYATDAGVVVYSGWNNYGYGNMIMIDHGNGFQSLYAHLSAIYRGCGVSVGQGEKIGAIGSTGRSSGAHLHFELMAGVKVNPWDYLPPP